MIASLRGRLVAGVLVLAAAGMLLVGAVTYASQRSFLLDRVDAQLTGATFALQHQLGGDDPYDAGPHRGGPPPGGGAPQDTYGQLRDGTGKVIASGFLGQDETGTAPRLPADIAVGDPKTVDTGSGEYRVLAQASRGGTVVVAAIPMSATNQTLERLLLVEGVVIVIALCFIGGFALVVVRVGLLPLDRMGHTAAAIAGGDLSHRVETTDPRTEVGRLGLALNRM
ncbi:MAG TPA: HAMP domain-containing protein, partial [Solirubrobacter sp.]